MSWTEEQTAYLKQLWTDGHSASQCALRVNERFRTCFTRSAVCGRIHRLGLSGRTKTSCVKAKAKRKPRRHAQSTPRARPVAVTPRQSTGRAAPEPDRPYRVDPVTAAGMGITAAAVASLERDHCKYPIGDPGTEAFAFCGAGRLPGRSYCPDHDALCHNPTASRRRNKPDPNRPYTPKPSPEKEIAHG